MSNDQQNAATLDLLDQDLAAGKISRGVYEVHRARILSALAQPRPHTREGAGRTALTVVLTVLGAIVLMGILFIVVIVIMQLT